MITNNYNPDVLSCIANLSNDEVFTPPWLANEILDLLPDNIWSDRNITFLDPCCKSGVFLREIAKRLINGLENEIPDREKRVNHIFTNQIFGIAITELTSLISRRSLYCSKTSNGKYSVCSTFGNKQGNIIFQKLEHNWVNGRCSYCGANQEIYERGEEIETHVYQFIHTSNPEEIFNNMKFDVIIGNPPYHLKDGGYGRSAGPIYNLFVQNSKKLRPRFLTMIIPSRWFAEGKGLNNFREEMLNDEQMRKIVDYLDSKELFPGVDIAGGICYFLWENGTSGPCQIINKHNGNEESSIRPLNEFNSLIRSSTAVSIIKKVVNQNQPKLSVQVSSRKPFGLATNVKPSKKGDLTLVWSGGAGPFNSKEVSKGHEIINKWKVITSNVSYDHGGQPDKHGKRRVLSKLMVLPPRTICTETYIVVGYYTNKIRARNLVLYLRTKFVRFLISQLSFSHHLTRERFSFVPSLSMNFKWTDEKLYKKYNLSKKEIEFIDSIIRPMEIDND